VLGYALAGGEASEPSLRVVRDDRLAKSPRRLAPIILLTRERLRDARPARRGTLR
jgi:hypothetical protein